MELTKTPVEITSRIVENPTDFSAFPTGDSGKASNWELRKHDDDVFIYQRWVEAEPGRKARELYAEIQVVPLRAKLPKSSETKSTVQSGCRWPTNTKFCTKTRIRNGMLIRGLIFCRP